MCQEHSLERSATLGPNEIESARDARWLCVFACCACRMWLSVRVHAQVVGFIFTNASQAAVHPLRDCRRERQV
jgi:hypothetical protein